MKLKTTATSLCTSADAREQREARQKARWRRMAACKCLLGCDTCDPPPKGWSWTSGSGSASV